MRNSPKDLIEFERKFVIKNLYLPRVLNFYLQVSDKILKFNPDNDLIQFSLVQGYTKDNYYKFLDKNADFILETKGKMKYVYNLRG
ncbi:MAG: hypothetical protein KatS3mg068_1522 [Candidatus Sericytochromatia bacterium]|nr:MAG: hypothetical protein KatS3mg068_1522 [Candidatus Sericytochromatia bacterium]